MCVCVQEGGTPSSRMGGGLRGRFRKYFFHIIFIVHNQNSNGGVMPLVPLPIVTPLLSPINVFL